MIPSWASPRDFRALGISLAPLVILVAISLVLFPSAGRDDSHITYWASYATARFGEIVNYNGDRIEQSSSLLHVLGLAVIAKLTSLPLPTIGGLGSILCGALTLIYTQKLAARFVGPFLAFSASLPK